MKISITIFTIFAFNIMAKITSEELKKRGWKYMTGSYKPVVKRSTKYWYLKGSHLIGDGTQSGKDTTGGYSYKLDKYPNCDIYILDLPYPNSDMGGWFGLREVDTLKQLDGLIKFLEIKV